MPKYTHHYIRVNEKGPFGKTVARVDVGDYNKVGRNKVWDRLDEKYGTENHISCYERTQFEMSCFEKDLSGL
jgi:hypothetical protein